MTQKKDTPFAVFDPEKVAGSDIVQFWIDQQKEIIARKKAAAKD